jgi:hypothetical protein
VEDSDLSIDIVQNSISREFNKAGDLATAIGDYESTVVEKY